MHENGTPGSGRRTSAADALRALHGSPLPPPGSRFRGAAHAAVHGAEDAWVFRDPNEDDRAWAVFDWDEAGRWSVLSDPEVPPVIPGHASRRQTPAWRNRQRIVPPVRRA